MFKYIEDKYINVDFFCDLKELYKQLFNEFMRIGNIGLIKFVLNKLKTIYNYDFLVEYNGLLSTIIFFQKDKELIDYFLEHVENNVNLCDAISAMIIPILGLLSLDKIDYRKYYFIIENLKLVAKKLNTNQFHLHNLDNQQLVQQQLNIISIGNEKFLIFLKQYYFEFYDSIKERSLNAAFSEGYLDSYIYVLKDMYDFENDKNNIPIPDNTLFFNFRNDDKFEIREWLHKNNYVKDYENDMGKECFERIIISENNSYLEFIFPKFKKYCDETILKRGIEEVNLFFIELIIKDYPELENVLKKVFTDIYNQETIVIDYDKDKQEMYLKMFQYPLFFDTIKNVLYENIFTWGIEKNSLLIVNWIMDITEIEPKKNHFEKCIINDRIDIFLFLYNNFVIDNNWVNELYMICSKSESLEILKYMYEKYDISDEILEESYKLLIKYYSNKYRVIGQKFVKWLSRTKYKNYFDGKNNINICIKKLDYEKNSY